MLQRVQVLAERLDRAWSRLPPTVQDTSSSVVVAVVCLLLLWLEPLNALNGVTRPADAWGTLLVLGATLPMALRRRAPAAVLVPMAACTVTALLLGYAAAPAVLWLGFGLCLLMVEVDRFQPALFGVLGSAAGLAAVVYGDRSQATPLTAMAAVVFGALPALIADVLRTQRRTHAAAVEQAGRELALRTSELHRTVAEERMQIARDVHDVVGHHLSAINLQAGGGRRVAMRGGSGRSAETFGLIEHLSSQALEETRRTLGMLRQATAELSPIPGLSDVGGLLSSFRSAGVQVDLQVAGHPVELSPAVETCAYRILQEALTNVAKHARPPEALVCIDYRPDALSLQVRDHGRGAGRRPRPGGHGLLGMRERAVLLGGELHAGPDGDGWQVRAVLPLAP